MKVPEIAIGGKHIFGVNMYVHVVKKGCVFLKLWKSGQIRKFPGDIVLQIQ